MAKASQVVIMEGEYYIIKSPNGKVLEVKDFNTENGAGIQLWHLECFAYRSLCVRVDSGLFF